MLFKWTIVKSTSELKEKHIILRTYCLNVICLIFFVAVLILIGMKGTVAPCPLMILMLCASRMQTCSLTVPFYRHYQRLLFFQIPIFFCIFRENFTVRNYKCNNFLGYSIFLERETILCCWELISPAKIISNWCF